MRGCVDASLFAAPEPKLADVLLRQCAEARAATAAKAIVERRENVSLAQLQGVWDLLKGAMTIAFPGGLPEYDEITFMFNGDFEADSRTMEAIPPADAALWWAGKQLMRGQKLQDFIGKNEKTKIVAKITKRDAHAPTREPVVDEQTQKEMMAFYFKKQEEMKKLEEEADDQYLHSAWANPKALKSQLHGAGNVSWKPGGAGAR